MIVSPRRVGRDGWGAVCAWANTPRCLLLSSYFSPKGKQRIERAAAVSVCESVSG